MSVCLSVRPSFRVSVRLSQMMNAKSTQNHHSDNWLILYAHFLCLHIHVIKTLSNTFDIEKTDLDSQGCTSF